MNNNAVPEPNPKPLKQLILVIAVLAFAIAGFWLLLNSRETPPAQPIPERSWNVTSMSATPGEYSPQLKIYGQISTPINSEITAAVSAYVSSLKVNEGAAVSAGQSLIQLDPRDIQLNVQQQQGLRDAILAQIDAEKVRYQADLKQLATERNLFALAQRSVERYRSLKGKNLSSELQLEDAERSYQQQLLSLTARETEIADHPNRLAQLEAQLMQAEANLAKTELDLERTDIQAPYNGRVSQILVAPGERVSSGTPLIRLFATDKLELKAQIPARYLPLVKSALNKGQTVQASTVFTDEPVNIKLAHLASEITNGQGGVYGFFRLPDEQAKAEIELGRSLELQLHLPPIANVVAVPAQSLYGTNRVYRVTEEQRIEAVTVEKLGETEINGETRVLVHSDQLQPTDAIITTQLPTAITGLKVNVVNNGL